MRQRNIARSFVLLFLAFNFHFHIIKAHADKTDETTVYMTEEEALKSAFPAGTLFAKKEFKLTVVQKAKIAKMAGRKFADESFMVHAAFKEKELLGFGVISEEIGKYRPITYFVAVTPKLAVMEVFVLVYRESRGGDIRHKRFLAQYKGKAAKDPIKANKDIINISGATISVRSLNFGVKKVLVFLAVIQDGLKSISP